MGAVLAFPAPSASGFRTAAAIDRRHLPKGVSSLRAERERREAWAADRKSFRTGTIYHLPPMTPELMLLVGIMQVDQSLAREVRGALADKCGANGRHAETYRPVMNLLDQLVPAGGRS